MTTSQKQNSASLRGGIPTSLININYFSNHQIPELTGVIQEIDKFYCGRNYE